MAEAERHSNAGLAVGSMQAWELVDRGGGRGICWVYYILKCIYFASFRMMNVPLLPWGPSARIPRAQKLSGCTFRRGCIQRRGFDMPMRGVSCPDGPRIKYNFFLYKSSPMLTTLVTVPRENVTLCKQ